MGTKATKGGLCLALAVAAACGMAEMANAETAAAGPTSAGSAPWPRIVWGGELEVQIQSDTNLGAKDRKAYNVAFTKTEGNFYLNVGDYLSLHSKVTLDQVRDRFRTGFFRDEGLFVEELYARVDLAPYAPFAIYGGKFNPRFGRGFDIAPGIYGDEFAQDYELTERLGIGIAWVLPVEFGRHEFRAEAFAADTTFLSNGWITRPSPDDPLATRIGRNRLSFGGASNTGNLSSTVISLRGGSFPGLRGLGYQISYSRQAPGQPANPAEDFVPFKVENGLSFSLYWEELPLTGRLSMTPLVEYVRLWHAGGGDANADYVTAALEFKYYAWKLSGVFGLRHFERGDEPNTRDRFASATLSYDLNNLRIGAFRFKNLEISAAYKALREDRVWRHTIGTQLVYLIKF